MPARVLDPEALHYYEVQHFPAQVVRGLEGVADGRRFDGRMEQRWLLAEIREEGIAGIEMRIGHTLDSSV